MNRKKKQLPDKKGTGKDLTYKLMQCLNKQISTKYMTLMITPNSFAVLMVSVLHQSTGVSR